MLAIFEVMDKEPSALWLAGCYGGVCVAAFLASRVRWWLGLLLLPVIVACTNIPELRDPYVGPEIVREAGWYYVALSYAMPITALSLTILAAIWQRKAQRAR